MTLESITCSCRKSWELALKLGKFLIGKDTPLSELLTVVLTNSGDGDVELINEALRRSRIPALRSNVNSIASEMRSSDYPLLVIHFTHNDVESLRNVLRRADSAPADGKVCYMICICRSSEEYYSFPLDVQKDIYRIAGLLLIEDSPSFSSDLSGFIDGVASAAYRHLRKQRAEISGE